MLAQLSCRSFRNLKSPEWQPQPGCHLILGPNGAGKTSLVEAVYLLATTRSFRTTQLLDCARHESQELHIEGEVQNDQRVHLAFGVSPAEGRYRSVNGNPTSLIDHLRVLPVVAWTTEDKEILSGPPQRRRRFVDQGIVSSRPGSLEILARFRRTLFQKRQLLASGGRGLEAWNQLMATSAGELMLARQDYVNRLATEVAAIVESTDLDLSEIRLEYRPSIRVEGNDPARILAELERVGPDERRERRPLIGPQRDEIVIRLGGHNIRQVGSAGERKIAGLLLTAARGRVLAAADRSPLYLLDDADSELDSSRLASVWRVFEGADQVFVTSSRPEVWSVANEAFRWRLEAGELRLESDP